MKQRSTMLFICAAITLFGSCKSDTSSTTDETVTSTTYSMEEGGAGQAAAGNYSSDTSYVLGSNTTESGANKTVIRNKRRKNNGSKKVVVTVNGTPGNYPESSERLLTDKDVRHLSPWGKKVMTNEIYARHGMKFSDPLVQEHFDKENWYQGKYNNVDKKLTAIEKQNLQMLGQ